MRRRRGDTLREEGERLLRQADPDDGFGYLRLLREEARKRAQRKGHVLSTFRARRYSRAVLNAACVRCARIAVVNASGDETVDKVYGPAVSERCTGDRQVP